MTDNKQYYVEVELVVYKQNYFIGDKQEHEWETIKEQLIAETEQNVESSGLFVWERKAVVVEIDDL